MTYDFKDAIEQKLYELKDEHPDYGYYSLIDEINAELTNNPNIYKPVDIPLWGKDEIKC